MSAGQGEDAERFAAAVEHGTSPDSADDLARELEIVAMLRSRGSAFAPDPEASARMKQRLMAALSQPGTQDPPTDETDESDAELTTPMQRITDGDTEPGEPGELARTRGPAPGVEPARPGHGGAVTHAPTASGRRSGRHQKPSRPAGRARGGKGPSTRSLPRRATMIASATLLALVAVAGGGAFASRDALPGDALYGVKRAAESIGLALTFDEEARARRHLELATTRLEELERLVQRDGAAGSASPTDPRVLEAIREFDAATAEGSRLLLTDEGDTAADTTLLEGWATQQAARLEALRSTVPVQMLAESVDLLTRLLGRAEALHVRSACTEVTAESADDLGPLPAEGKCVPRPVDPDELETSSTATEPGPEPVTSATTGTTPTGTTEPETTSLPQTTDVQSEPGTSGTPNDATPDTTPGSPGPDGELDGMSVPLPLLPPITLPPLLPGMPGITIGG